MNFEILHIYQRSKPEVDSSYWETQNRESNESHHKMKLVEGKNRGKRRDRGWDNVIENCSKLKIINFGEAGLLTLQNGGT